MSWPRRVHTDRISIRLDVQAAAGQHDALREALASELARRVTRGAAGSEREAGLGEEVAARAAEQIAAAVRDRRGAR